MTKLVVDDLRILNLPGRVIYARDPQVALAYLSSKKKWEELWLDHDMGYADGHVLDIWPVIEYLEERIQYDPIKIREVYVITSNPVGAQRMKLALDKMGYATTVMDPKRIMAGTIPW